MTYAPDRAIHAADLAFAPFIVPRLRRAASRPGLRYQEALIELGGQLLGVLCDEIGEDRALAFAARLTGFPPAASAAVARQRREWEAVLAALVVIEERP